MAKSYAVIVHDDLDGSEGAETVAFGYDGVTYEIDLTDANRTRMERAVGPYITAGRRVSGKRVRKPRVVVAPPPPVIDTAQVRAWARSNGFQVSERGRISAEVLRQYKAAL